MIWEGCLLHMLCPFSQASHSEASNTLSLLRSAEEPTSAWRVGVKSGAAAARAARRAQRLAASGDQDVEAQRTGRSDLFVLDDVGADGRQEFRAAALQVKGVVLVKAVRVHYTVNV